MKGTEDLLMVFTKSEYKDHRPKSREESDLAVLMRSKGKLGAGGTDRSKGLVRGEWVRRKCKAEEHRRAKMSRTRKGIPSPCR